MDYIEPPFLETPNVTRPCLNLHLHIPISPEMEGKYLKREKKDSIKPALLISI
jgi:hypothetical protein